MNKPVKKRNIVIIFIVLVIAAGLFLSYRHHVPGGREGPAKSGQKILFYRNPMNPEITSPVPMKDQMGMDYVPVYEEEERSTEGAGIYINPEKQQLIGVKKDKVEKRDLSYELRTVGRVAYDPELYIAQQEYLQALKAKNSTSDSSIPLVKEQMVSLLESAQQRLLLLGMSKEEIEDLARQGKPQRNLYLPLDEKTVWVYVTIYEYEAGLIKEGLPVKIDAVSFPGEVFDGKIIAITPILDAATRSLNVRAEVENPGHKLKPQMYVNVGINIELGEKLAVPEEAVMDTGERQVVFIAKPDGYFESREVKLGNKAEGYYEVVSGLEEGEEVVSSGNFFIDSESKLKSAVSTEPHQHE